jgi:hypothetical protein
MGPSEYAYNFWEWQRCRYQRLHRRLEQRAAFGARDLGCSSRQWVLPRPRYDTNATYGIQNVALLSKRDYCELRTRNGMAISILCQSNGGLLTHSHVNIQSYLGAIAKHRHFFLCQLSQWFFHRQPNQQVAITLGEELGLFDEGLQCGFCDQDAIK